MAQQHPFKWRHFEAEIILLCVRWYLRYALSYRDLEEMLAVAGRPMLIQRRRLGCLRWMGWGCKLRFLFGSVSLSVKALVYM